MSARRPAPRDASEPTPQPRRGPPPRAPKAFTLLEADFQSRITGLCDLLNLKWHHEVDSRKSKSGFPDLVIAGPNGVLFAELKKTAGRTRPDQLLWINSLKAAGAEVHLWYPADWPFIYKRLHELAGRPTPRSIP